jgi:hypothetical protein
MNTTAISEIRQLKVDELDEVTGGFVQVLQAPVGPYVQPPPPAVNPGGTISDGGAPAGGGGGTVDYTGDPYNIHHLF